MNKYIVTALGPIDLHKPGEDVTNAYDADTLVRLVEEGYIAVTPKRKAKPRKDNI